MLVSKMKWSATGTGSDDNFFRQQHMGERFDTTCPSTHDGIHFLLTDARQTSIDGHQQITVTFFYSGVVMHGGHRGGDFFYGPESIQLTKIGHGDRILQHKGIHLSFDGSFDQANDACATGKPVVLTGGALAKGGLFSFYRRLNREGSILPLEQLKEILEPGEP